MGHFRLEDDANAYFEKIPKPSKYHAGFAIKLQKYWLCALLGLASNENRDPIDTGDVVDSFPTPLREHAHLIRALAFWRYASERGVGVDNPDDIMDAIRCFFDDDAGSRMSGGVAELDKFAAGGFDIIRNRWPSPPQDLDTFLLGYVQALEDAKDSKARSEGSPRLVSRVTPLASRDR